MKILSFCNDGNNSSSDDVGGSVGGWVGDGGAGVPPLPGPRHTSQLRRNPDRDQGRNLASLTLSLFC